MRLPNVLRAAAAVIAALLPFVLPGQAAAQITVSRSVLEFTAESRVQDVEILNSGDIRVYLDIKPAEIIDPASASPERRALDDPRTAPLIISPNQLLLAPGERKRVRIIMRDVGASEERVFRLAINPYVGKLRVDGERDDAKDSASKVLVGYDLLLLLRPLPLEPKVEVTRTEDAIEFVNTGNTNVLLRSIKQCDSAGEDCEEMEPKRLYVGERLRLKLPKIGTPEQFPVEVLRSVGLENAREVY